MGTMHRLWSKRTQTPPRPTASLCRGSCHVIHATHRHAACSFPPLNSPRQSLVRNISVTHFPPPTASPHPQLVPDPPPPAERGGPESVLLCAAEPAPPTTIRTLHGALVGSKTTEETRSCGARLEHRACPPRPTRRDTLRQRNGSTSGDLLVRTRREGIGMGSSMRSWGTVSGSPRPTTLPKAHTTPSSSATSV